jgi:hypothetical protein
VRGVFALEIAKYYFQINKHKKPTKFCFDINIHKVDPDNIIETFNPHDPKYPNFWKTLAHVLDLGPEKLAKTIISFIVNIPILCRYISLYIP